MVHAGMMAQSPLRPVGDMGDGFALGAGFAEKAVKSLPAPKSGNQPAASLESSSLRKFVGEFPVKRAKLRLNWESDW